MSKKLESGLFCDILKAKGRVGSCALGGISETANEVLLILPEGGPFDTDDASRLGRPVVRLVRRIIGGKEYLHVEPDAEGMWAAGGCFIETSDSRFPHRYPLSLHDRDMRKERG